MMNPEETLGKTNSERDEVHSVKKEHSQKEQSETQSSIHYKAIIKQSKLTILAARALKKQLNTQTEVLR